MDYELALQRKIFLEKQFIRVSQGNYEMFMLSFTADELIHYTAVHYFKNDMSNKGYQRQLITNHYRKISKYIEEEIIFGNDPILPPAILAATDPDDVEIKINIIKLNRVIRIVDGQHRIRGLKYLKDNNPEVYAQIKNYEFPVILMIIKDKQKIHEVNTFVNINSKGKKVSTDLAILLRDRIREEEFNEHKNHLDDKEFQEAIATAIVKKLDQSIESIWYNLIKMAGGSDDKGKPISINAFNQSLKEIISLYLQTNCIDNTQVNVSGVADDISPYIINIWKLITQKWPECFNYYELVKHNPQFNIQKGIGVYPIHQLGYESLAYCSTDFSAALNHFKEVIHQSHVEYTDWKVGGILSSYNSRAGFKNIASFIKNEINLYDF